MKPHRKRISAFKLNATRVLCALAVSLLTVSATLLSSVPVHAQSTSPVTLQCQVSTNSNGYALGCSGNTPAGGVTLTCQSPYPISNNQGVFTADAVNCNGTIALAGITVPGTLSVNALTIDSNTGLITATDGTGTLTVNQGLSSVTMTCHGSTFSTSLSPLALNLPQGTCTVTPGVLGIGTAQVTFNSGSIMVTGSPDLTITVNAQDISATASLLGLLDANLACGSSVAIHLNQIFPIAVPFVSCSAS